MKKDYRVLYSLDNEEYEDYIEATSFEQAKERWINEYVAYDNELLILIEDMDTLAVIYYDEYIRL